MLTIPGLSTERRHSNVLESPLASARTGLMLHYDDSSRDDWALAWFEDPRCTNGYTWLALDDGQIIELADPGMRTPHAGPCLTPRANSAFYGIAAATNGLVLASEAQLGSIISLCAAVARFHRWTPESLSTRIAGHDAEAVWTPDYTMKRELWGRVGRKIDPTGNRSDGRKILDVGSVRVRVAQIL